MPKIIDCFTFYNEIDLLKFRLAELYDYVDKFILVEANLTHSGNPKELYYEKNKELFKEYNDKIVHIVVNDMQSISGDWTRENYQRECIDRGIKSLNLNDEDIIIISDLDEIIDGSKLSELLVKCTNIDSRIYCPNVDAYYYNLTCKSKKDSYIIKLVSYQAYKIYNCSPQNIRMSHNNCVCIEGRYGWNLSFFGDVEFIKNKLRNFAHQELNLDCYVNDETIKRQIKNCDDLFCYHRDNKSAHWFEYFPLDQNNYLPKNYEMLLKFNDVCN